MTEARKIAPRGRLLEAYWAGVAAWVLRRRGPWWRRDVLGERLQRAVLDVGEALVAERHGADALPLALDRLDWLLGLAERQGRPEVPRLREALAAVSAMAR
ncbi:MAG: hypothetical protein R3F59_13830 [Myxococcota bacterium]